MPVEKMHGDCLVPKIKELWLSGLRNCIAVLAVPLEILGSSPGSAAAGSRPGGPWGGAQLAQRRPD